MNSRSRLLVAVLAITAASACAKPAETGPSKLRYQLSGPLIPAKMTMVTAWDFPQNPLTDSSLDQSKLSKEIQWGYRLFINTPAEAEFGANVARELVGAENFVPDLDPSMGAEDFSFMLMEKPGAYFRIGQGGGEAGCFLHNTRFDFNDNILPLGAALLSRLTERWLAA